jgi:hypothetical protein
MPIEVFVHENPPSRLLGGEEAGWLLDAVVWLACTLKLSGFGGVRSADPLGQETVEDGAILGRERVWIGGQDPPIRGLIVPEDDPVFSYPVVGLAGVCPQWHQATPWVICPGIIVQGVALNHEWTAFLLEKRGWVVREYTKDLGLLSMFASKNPRRRRGSVSDGHHQPRGPKQDVGEMRRSRM